MTAASVLSLVAADRWAGAQDPGRVQHVADRAGRPLEVLDGVPVWSSVYGRDRLNTGCVPAAGGPRVVLMGDSILHGVRLDLAETVGPKLQDTLPGPQGCVYNLAQPAFAMQNELALGRRDLAGLGPDVVVWEIWENSPNAYTMVGGDAWNFGQLEVDGRGVPSVFGLPEGLNHALFVGSGLYRWATLGRVRQGSRRDDEVWEAFSATALDAALDLTVAAGATLVLVLMPRLDQPFAVTAASGHPGYAWVRRWAAREGVAVVDVADAWAGVHEPEDVRVDTCCHLNGRGHTLLTTLLAPEVVTALGGER